MHEPRRISRIIEHWTLPAADQVLDHVRRAQIQLVQVGNFGSDFYSLAEAADLPPSWAGMPLRGIRANLDLAAEVIPQIREAGASVVGQLSTTMIFGNHEENLGLFGATWSQLWADDLLGAAPTADLAALVQRLHRGRRRCWGFPYKFFCLSLLFE